MKSSEPATPRGKREFLIGIKFGNRVAEEEDGIEKYFVETDQWRRLLTGEIDIVRGPKGSGKSALYLLLDKQRDNLQQSNIFLVSGENIRGNTVFKDVSNNPPITELQFVSLWKIYFMQLIIKECMERKLTNRDLMEVKKFLVDSDLIEDTNTLSRLLRSSLRFVRKTFNVSATEATASLDPATSVPTISFRAEYDEKVGEGIRDLVNDIDDLLEKCNEGLNKLDANIWLLFDRLDVAFSENVDIEVAALRALFKSYNDLKGLDRISLKIFIRDDIWKRIFQSGFREASHLTKIDDIEWNRNLIINMIAKRMLSSDSFVINYDVDGAQVLLDISKQEELFYMIFPDQVDVGSRRPNTIDWIIKRTQDGLEKISPREIIHLLDESQKSEIKKMEAGENLDVIKPLISSASLKEGVSKVSRFRIENTVLSEYPQLSSLISALKGSKSRHSLATLKNVWSSDDAKTRENAEKLAEIGLFKKENRADGNNYWIPFLYRDGLEVSQGTADYDE